MARILVGSADALGDGGAIKVNGAHGAIAVFNVQGAFYALSDRCSHGNASMSDGYVEDDATVECPLHAARFCLKTGAALCQPATEPLKTFAVVVDAGALYVDEPEAA
ncbi:bifunctional 3-phenylpropionate/cinnamic acid dioxygenase ferredoxin subunit [Burkholderia pyrrocinia]|uniref:Bifunctional 3-phenylpropionate/cinnamic acid dioxygenase ferredoxin subunit n=1 Tax=Burkholderia pyrrocinia TaxID=60550 RepID=A0A2Z5N7I4_BURPY|nr:3-phenylpropionate/cinnamic acid dioxygenase ferredoxin subunit [Burkholderia pyrrocinia]AXF25551.1 bifunctional 3-phenylpropionate/cinnamic acid dioxygenase ferredoxin subunit [Burkholderia pyrrocinia]